MHESVIERESENTKRDYVHKLALRRSLRVHVHVNVTADNSSFSMFLTKKDLAATEIASLINHFVLKIMSLKLSDANTSQFPV